uniref:Uncharacterized protein n=1 Tax=Onchocerca volvulus TaxID=6282 RepID=A0A8R1TIP3_ONCVO
MNLVSKNRMISLRKILIRIIDRARESNVKAAIEQRHVENERTVFQTFLEAGGLSKNCGLIDHTEIFCPKMSKLSYISIMTDCDYILRMISLRKILIRIIDRARESNVKAAIFRLTTAIDII